VIAQLKRQAAKSNRPRLAWVQGGRPTRCLPLGLGALLFFPSISYLYRMDILSA